MRASMKKIVVIMTLLMVLMCSCQVNVDDNVSTVDEETQGDISETIVETKSEEAEASEGETYDTSEAAFSDSTVLTVGVMSEKYFP